MCVCLWLKREGEHVYGLFLCVLIRDRSLAHRPFNWSNSNKLIGINLVWRVISDRVERNTFGWRKLRKWNFTEKISMFSSTFRIKKREREKKKSIYKKWLSLVLQPEFFTRYQPNEFKNTICVCFVDTSYIHNLQLKFKLDSV